MLEFTPIDFFSVNKTVPMDYEESDNEADLPKHQSEESRSTIHDEESAFSASTLASSKKTTGTSYSENHNMVKQLIITIKKMIGKYILDVGCSYNSRKIISEVWKVFEKTKTPTKEILKAMFNKEVNTKLVEKVGLGSLLREYGNYEYLNAMDDLRMEIVFMMRSQNLKSHLFARNVQKKERLEAYVQYFVEEELRIGKISSRFSEAAGRRMTQILNNNKTQAECIDCYFQDSNEAFVRFAS